MPSCADRKRPQLSLEDLLHLRWQLGGALALLSVWTLFYLEAAIWPVGLVATAAILIAMAFPALPGRVPRALWQGGMPAIAVFFAIDLYTQELIPAFVRLTVLLVLYRAVAHRTRREDLQLVVLCLFLIVVTGVLTVSIAFAAQIVAFTAVAMAYLFVVNLIRDAQNETDELPPAQWALISRKRLLQRVWGNIDLRMFALGCALLGAVVAISTAIFLGMPRFQMDGTLSLFQFNRSRSVTGFAESIALGEITEITQDHSVAMRVDVPQGVMRPTVPYWRMVVLDEYGAGAFRVSRAVQAKVGARAIAAREFAPEWWPDPPGAGLDDAPPEPAHTVFLEGGISRYLPLPGAFNRIRFKDTEHIVPNPVFGLVSTPRQSAGLFSYQIEGGDFSGVVPDPDFGETVLKSPPRGRPEAGAEDAQFLYRLLNYPATTTAVPVDAEDRAYLRSAVETITGGETLDAPTFAQRACAFLAETHAYSMSVALDDADAGSDPVTRWMRSGLAGHCEFFASAFTLLARTAGFPTRAITGFKGGSWNAYENYYMVRNSDAHAWCEVFDGEGAWFRVDPTPGAGGARGGPELETALAAMVGDRSMSAYFDSLRMIWYRRIVSFDERSQREVVGSLKSAGGRAASGAGTLLGRAFDGFLAWMHRPWTLQGRAGLIYLFAIGVAVFHIARRSGARVSDLWGRLARGEAATRRRAGALLRRLQLRLAEPRAHDRWDPARARELEEKLSVIRYGRSDRWPEPLPVFRAARRLL